MWWKADWQVCGWIITKAAATIGNGFLRPYCHPGCCGDYSLLDHWQGCPVEERFDLSNTVSPVLRIGHPPHGAVEDNDMARIRHGRNYACHASFLGSRRICHRRGSCCDHRLCWNEAATTLWPIKSGSLQLESAALYDGLWALPVRPLSDRERGTANGGGERSLFRLLLRGSIAVHMTLKSITVLSLFLLAGCGPSYVWGDEADTARELLQMVPQGSSLNDLRAEAGRRGWKLNQRNIHTFEPGEPHYFDGCDGKGGPAVPVIIADYRGPLRTTVETLWIYGPTKRLIGVCVRRSVDGL
jgi:hypothetical protein